MGEPVQWDADAQKGVPRSLPPCEEPRSALPVSTDIALNRLAAALEAQNAVMLEQNRALWALIEQTAVLIEQGLPSDDDDSEGAGNGRYLDGSPVSG